MSSRLRLFIPSPASRLFPQVSQFLRSKGIAINVEGRELFLQIGYLDVFLSRGFDIPKIVAAGWGDLGITGLDAVEEAEADVVLLCKLGIRFSDVVVASTTLQSISELRSKDIVVTEYRKLAHTYFHQKQIHDVSFFYVTGAAESFGMVPDVSAIVTLITSGQTLRDNRFKVLDTIFHSQVCLLANSSSFESKKLLVTEFLQSLHGRIQMWAENK